MFGQFAEILQMACFSKQIWNLRRKKKLRHPFRSAKNLHFGDCLLDILLGLFSSRGHLRRKVRNRLDQQLDDIECRTEIGFLGLLRWFIPVNIANNLSRDQCEYWPPSVRPFFFTCLTNSLTKAVLPYQQQKRMTRWNWDSKNFPTTAINITCCFQKKKDMFEKPTETIHSHDSPSEEFCSSNFHHHHDESLWGLQTDFPKRLAALEKLAQVPSPFSSSAMAFFV